MTTIENFPAVIATEAHPKLSGRYSFVSTNQIVELFKNEGFAVRKVSQTRARKNNNPNFVAHEVRMGFGDYGKVGDTIPEIIIGNSHNGSTSLTITPGLFRLVCTNGLKVPVEGLTEIFKIRHTGIEEEDIKTMVNQFGDFLPAVQERVRRMQQTEMSKDEAREFLHNSVKLRFPNEDVKLNHNELLRSVRPEDSAPTVWNYFNVVQEKFIKGGFKVTKNDKKERTAKKISSFLRENSINNELWKLAETYSFN